MSHGHSHGGGGDGHGHAHDLEKPLMKEEHGHGHGAHSGEDHQEGCCGGVHGRSDAGHGHSHGGAKQKQDESLAGDKRKMKIAIYCAAFFMLVEIAGGVFSNSLAIITDAAHMLSDVGGFIVSFMALSLAEMEATKEYTYGFHQADVLGALLSIMIVWALTAILLWEAMPRFYEPQEIDGQMMLIISVIGFAVNLVLMKVLGHGHSHEGGDHGHAHGAGGEELSSAAVQAALAHVIGDIVQSLGVCVAASLIWLKPMDIGITDQGVSKWNYADPCCTVLFGILVLYTTKGTLVRTVSTLMARAPDSIDQVSLASRLESLPHVESIHDLHVWTLGSKEILCTAHVMVKGRDNATVVLNGAIKVAQSMGIGHSTFQIEIFGEFDPALESYGSLHKNHAKNVEADEGHGHSHGGGGHGHAR